MACLGGKSLDVNYIVSGYKFLPGRGPEKVVRLLRADTSWQPQEEMQGWFWGVVRKDLLTYYKTLLGKRLAELPVKTVAAIAALVLDQTSRMCFSVSNPIWITYIYEDHCEPVDPAPFLERAAKIEVNLRAALRDGLLDEA